MAKKKAASGKSEASRGSTKKTTRKTAKKATGRRVKPAEAPPEAGETEADLESVTAAGAGAEPEPGVEAEAAAGPEADVAGEAGPAPAAETRGEPPAPEPVAIPGVRPGKGDRSERFSGIQNVFEELGRMARGERGEPGVAVFVDAGDPASAELVGPAEKVEAILRARAEEAAAATVAIADVEDGRRLGAITPDDLRFLLEHLVLEHEGDRDLYVTAVDVDYFESQGAREGLVAFLRAALGERTEMEIRFEPPPAEGGDAPRPSHPDLWGFS